MFELSVWLLVDLDFDVENWSWVFSMAWFDATKTCEMLMDFFDNDNNDEKEVLVDLEEILTDNG